MNNLKIIFVFLLITASFTNCTKTEDTPSSVGVGSFTLNSNNYTTAYGYLSQYTNSTSKKEFSITFSDATSAQNVGNAKIEMTFVIIPSGGTLANGTYSYDLSHNTNLIEAFVRLREGTNESQWEVSPNGIGYITITKTNDNYVITYSFVAIIQGNSTNEQTITGSYKGKLTSV